MWALLLPKLMANVALWYPIHHLLGYWGFFIVNDGAKINYCNPHIMQCVVCTLFNWMFNLGILSI
jgi:hypothetical protein